MSWLFSKTEFNNDISRWNVANVKNMRFMFGASKFNNDISQWNVTNMNGMFYDCLAPEPYWLNCDNKDQRAKAIDSHTLAQQLQNNLSNKPSFKKNKDINGSIANFFVFDIIKR